MIWVQLTELRCIRLLPSLTVVRVLENVFVYNSFVECIKSLVNLSLTLKTPARCFISLLTFLFITRLL